jgi:PAS domain S-box-containing protein
MKQIENYQILNALNASKHTVTYIGELGKPMIYITPSVENLLGYPVENYYKYGFWESLIHQDDIAIVNDFFTRIQEISEFKVTVRAKKADGNFISIINAGTVIKEENCIVAVIGNLYPLKETENTKKVLDLKSYYSETLLENIGLIFYAVDNEFKIIAKNKLFDKWAWDKFEIIYQIGDPIFHSKIPDSLALEYKKAYATCVSKGFFTYRITRNEKEYDLALSPIIIKNLVEGISVFHFDKSSQRNLLNVASFLNNALENKSLTNQELVYTLDKEFKFISFNEAFSRLYFSYLGKDPEIGKQTEFVLGDSSISINLKNWYHKVLKGDYIDTVLYMGNQMIHLKISPCFNNNNEVCGLTAINKDITVQNESQKKLIESEEKYKYVVDHVTDIVFQTDQEGFWSYLNNAWETIMEFTIEESINTLFFTYLHPDDVERNQILFTPLINREKNYCTHEIRYITKSGKIKWIRVFATLLLDIENNIKGTTGTLKDITIEKENTYRYELLSKNVNDLVCLLETDGTFLYVSPSFSNLLGISIEEIIGKNVKHFIHPEDIESIVNFSNSSYESKDLDSYSTYRFKNKNEGYHWIETNAKIFYDVFYGRKLINASSRIIDERKILEQQLLTSLEKERQLNQLKSKFVSMASHEFRTPMTTIKTSAELAGIYLESENALQVAKAKKHIKTIDEEIDRLSALVNDILVLGKIESDTYELHKGNYNISQTIKEIIKKQCDLQEDNRKVEFKEKGIAQLFEFDKTFMHLIFENLISNAFKYSLNRKGPKICVTYFLEKVEISITDYGIGIPKEEQGQMFKSFFRASNVQNIKGTGIGLVLVHYFIELHGGEVTFISKQNMGTTFTIVLPYTSTEE